jgi:hypothetical protein
VLWVLLDVALCLMALVVLGALALRLWRQVKALGREVSASADRVSRATGALDAAQSIGRPPVRSAGPRGRR